jgi:hypothetical protein
VFDSQRGLKIFFTIASITALGTTQPPVQWVPGALSLGVKLQGREADQSPPSSAEIKNAWSYFSNTQYVFMAWCLVKHRDNFTFTSALVSHVEYIPKYLTLKVSEQFTSRRFPVQESKGDSAKQNAIDVT